MTASGFDELLNEWRLWVFRKNNASGVLGYAMSGYTERIGGGAYGPNTPDVRTDLDRLNSIITSDAFPSAIRDIILLHYIDPLPAKAKYGDGANAKEAYYTRLKLAKSVLMELYLPQCGPPTVGAARMGLQADAAQADTSAHLGVRASG